MATYSLATTAVALNTTRKRLENIVSRYHVPGSRLGRQGRTRRLSQETVVALALVLELQDQAGVAVGRAIDLAAALLATRSNGAIVSASAGRLTISVELGSLDRELADALREALLIAPRPRRGRPPFARRARAVTAEQ